MIELKHYKSHFHTLLKKSSRRYWILPDSNPQWIFFNFFYSRPLLAFLYEFYFRLHQFFEF